jgi:hypothetical protein
VKKGLRRQLLEVRVDGRDQLCECPFAGCWLLAAGCAYRFTAPSVKPRMM